MQLLDATEDDCRLAAQLIKMLQGGEYRVTGKDMCAGADSLRWFQGLAVKLAESLNDKNPPPGGLNIRSVKQGQD